jgi:hypothetical protein
LRISYFNIFAEQPWLRSGGAAIEACGCFVADSLDIKIHDIKQSQEADTNLLRPRPEGVQPESLRPHDDSVQRRCSTT